MRASAFASIAQARSSRLPFRSWCLGLALLGTAGLGSWCRANQATWAGGDGLWTDPTMWVPMVVPNNGTPPNVRYAVQIGGSTTPLSNVTLPSGNTINIFSLDLAAGNTLSLDAGSNLGVVGATNSIVEINDGTLNLASGSQFTIPAGGTLEGTGTINLPSGATLGGTGGMPIALMGQTLLAAGTLNVSGWHNAGTIRTQPGQMLMLNGSFSNMNGLLDVEGGGTLVLQGHVDGSAASGPGPNGLTVGPGSTAIVNGSIGGNLDVFGNGTIQGPGSLVGNGAIANSSTGIINLAGTGDFVGSVENPAGGMITIPSLNLTKPTGFTNAGTIQLQNLRTNPEQTGDALLVGGGQLFIGTATKPGLVQPEGTLVNVDQTIHASGMWVGPFVNEGTILADMPGASLTISGPTAPLNVNAGTMGAGNGGHLILASGTSITGAGAWTANGGTITFQNGAKITTAGPISVTGGGRLELPSGNQGLSTTTLIASNLTIDSTSSISNHGIITLLGNFSYAMSDPKQWDWPGGPKPQLTMDGGISATTGSAAGWATLELGEKDNGPNGTGYDTSFAIPRLEIGPGAHVLLQDLLDNGNRGGPAGAPEALYVDRLLFDDPTGQIDLNGLHLYYRQLGTGSADQIVNVPLSVPEPGGLAIAGIAPVLACRRRARHLARGARPGRA